MQGTVGHQGGLSLLSSETATCMAALGWVWAQDGVKCSLNDNGASLGQKPVCDGAMQETCFPLSQEFGGCRAEGVASQHTRAR